MGFVARITIGPQLTLSLITILVTLFLPLKTSITTIRIPSRIFFRTLLIASTMTSIEPRRTRCVFVKVECHPMWTDLRRLAEARREAYGDVPAVDLWGYDCDCGYGYDFSCVRAVTMFSGCGVERMECNANL
ncbi:hypothetical protein BDQ17DRAFT_1378010 [Cyathus striatus]|nr:hypothetical protein BDQ17DRAFT_1378010 [Cyathus striatus]